MKNFLHKLTILVVFMALVIGSMVALVLSIGMQGSGFNDETAFL